MNVVGLPLVIMIRDYCQVCTAAFKQHYFFYWDSNKQVFLTADITVGDLMLSARGGCALGQTATKVAGRATVAAAKQVKSAYAPCCFNERCEIELNVLPHVTVAWKRQLDVDDDDEKLFGSPLVSLLRPWTHRVVLHFLISRLSSQSAATAHPVLHTRLYT